MQLLQISSQLKILADDYDIDTICQGLDGNDYIVCNTTPRSWQLFHDNTSCDSLDHPLEIFHFIITNDPKAKKKKGRPMKVSNKETETKNKPKALTTAILETEPKTKPKITATTPETIATTTKPKARGRPRKVDNKPRPPRQPTAYNIFLQKTLKELGVQYPQVNNKERMKIASELWQKFKESHAAS